jgi:hypothetical protein
VKVTYIFPPKIYPILSGVLDIKMSVYCRNLIVNGYLDISACSNATI